MLKSVKHYCQKCLAANPLGQELCGRCGTRLMLVVEPAGARYEDGGMVASHEEHLLERISALENRLMRMTDKLEQTLDLMLRQARNAYFDHALIDTLIEVLNDSGSLDAVLLNKLWRERCRRDELENQATTLREQLKTKILWAYSGTDSASFERQVKEGFDKLKESEAEQGIRMLESASALDPQNGPLNAFLGERFFEERKDTLARDYLSRAHTADSKIGGVPLLLGLVCGDAGELELARRLLTESMTHLGESFAARYALGRLLGHEERWAEAVKEFKSALKSKPSSPEAHYVLGCAYYHAGRDRMAMRHLRKAIELDAGYAAAAYALGIALLRAGEVEKARESLRGVCEIAGEDERHYLAAARSVLRVGKPPARLKFFGTSQDAKTGLMTGVDKRLARVIREDALETARTRSMPG